MRKIEIEPGLRVRFLGQDSDFDDGFEAGLVAAQMAAGRARIERTVKASVVAQIDVLAKKLAYRMEVTEAGENAHLHLERVDLRPRLRLVAG